MSVDSIQKRFQERRGNSGVISVDSDSPIERAPTGISASVESTISSRFQARRGIAPTIPEAPTQIGMGSRIGEASKETGKFALGFGEKGFLTEGFRGIRALSTAIAAPVAAGFAAISQSAKRDGATPSAAASEALQSAKNIILAEEDPEAGMLKASQMYLKDRGIKSMDDIRADDIAVLTGMGIINFFGDVTNLPILKGFRALKEAATFKTVGKVRKVAPEGTTIIRPQKVEVPIGPNAKVVIEPKTKTITFTGKVRRRPVAGEIREVLDQPTTAQADETTIAIKAVLGEDAPVTTVSRGDDLVVRIGTTEARGAAMGVEKLAALTPVPQESVMPELKKLASDAGFATITERESPIVDRINNQNAPTGVIPGRKELQVYIPELQSDIAHLIEGKPIEHTIGGETVVTQMKPGQSVPSLINEYLTKLIAFEKQHLLQTTVGEAAAIEQGAGATVAKGMDERITQAGRSLRVDDFKTDTDWFNFGAIVNEKWENLIFEKTGTAVSRRYPNAQEMKALQAQFDATQEVITKAINRYRYGGVIPSDTRPVVTSTRKPPTRKSTSIVTNESVVKHIIGRRSSLPILEHFLVKDGVLRVTDLEISATLKTDLPDGMYKLVGKDNVKSTEDASDFPTLPEVETDLKVTLPSGTLQDAFTKATLSLGDGSGRQELSGVLIKIANGRMLIASTDSYRLFTKEIPTEITDDAEFILSNTEKLSKILPALGEQIGISVGKDYAKFTGDRGEVIVRIIDGAYPDIQKIIPSFTTRYAIDRKALAGALKELKAYIPKRAFATVQFTVKDGALTLHVKTTELEKTLTIPAESIAVNTEKETFNDGVLVMPVASESDAEGILLNRSYIDDALRTFDGDTAYIYRTESVRSPVFVSGEEKLREKAETLPIEKPKKKRAPSGVASAGGDALGDFESLAGIPDKTPEQLKIYEKVKMLIAKYAKTIGEDYLPRNALGVYYPKTTNIRISGLNNLSVAAHEITHFLDFAYKISERLRGIKGYSKKGNPIYVAETAKYRKEMTDLYEKYYPGAKRTHKLKKRMQEAFATLLEKYIAQPTMIAAEFPTLVNDFLMEGGKFYEPVMGDILADLREIITEAQGLPALDRIGARIVNDKVNVNKESFLNFFEKVKTEVADEIYPIEALAKRAGLHFQKGDPSLWVRQYNNSSAIILNNINGKRGYWGWRKGDVMKLHDFNWRTLIESLEGEKNAESFGAYLVARREYFLYQELKGLEAPGPRLALETILKNDGFTEEEVAAAYLENKERFAKQEIMYDQLVHEDLRFLNDEQVQLVNDDEYAQLSQQQGYASFKRYFYDEVVGEEEPSSGQVRVGSAKVSSLLRRTGSQKPIINPVFSAIKNHAEITRKGLKQIIRNRIVQIAVNQPDLGVFQPLALKPVRENSGRILYPQERDPNIIMGRIGYKRVPVLADATITRTVNEVLTFQNINIFESFLLGTSRFFTKGTTGLFPGFTITNTAVDQITAAAQTRNKFLPIYDQLARMGRTLDRTSPERVYLQEYLIMGGERQTFVGWQDLSPNEFVQAVIKERKGLLKAVDAVNAGMDILALPSKWSEILTRATEYIKARKSGKPSIVALEEAGRVTAPFHHIGRLGGGRIGKTFIKSIPFFNPGIQVLAQAAETLNTPAGRNRYLFIALAVTAASLGGMALILGTGTDKQKDSVADLSPDELNKYIFVPNPDGDSLIKIRVPDQMAVFATLINMVIMDKTLKANYTAGEYLNAGASWLPQQANPTEPIRMFLSWVPQIIKPGFLAIANIRDFPTVRPLESMAMQSRSPGIRFTESTSPVAKKLGELLNISPIKIDFLLTGYAGRASGFLTGKPGVYNPLKQLQREYYFTSGRKLQRYYDLKEQNDQRYSDFKNRRLEMSEGEVQDIMHDRELLKQIDNALDEFRSMTPGDDPSREESLRDEIIERINELP